MSGPDPIGGERRRADQALMTLLLTPPRIDEPFRSSRGTTSERRSIGELRDRIERSDYLVEPDRIAEAMLARLRDH